MKGYVYLNGSIVSADKARVSVFDRGLNYGDGLFETIRARNGRPQFLGEHIRRLKAGLKFLGLENAIKALEEDIAEGAIERLLGKNGFSKKEANVKIVVTRGIDTGAHAPPKAPTPTVIIMVRPIDTALVSKLVTEGVKATSIKGFRPAFAGIKSLNYLPNVLGKSIALNAGAFEGIFVDNSGHILEGTSSNIFIVKGGVIKTPLLGKDPSFGVLPGITREIVLKIARKKGLKAVETGIKHKELMGSDEAFLTNSIIGVAPIVEVDGKAIGRGKAPHITRLLQALLQAFP